MGVHHTLDRWVNSNGHEFKIRSDLYGEFKIRSDLYGMLGRFEGWQVVILLSAFAVHLACTKSRQIHIIF